MSKIFNTCLRAAGVAGAGLVLAAASHAQTASPTAVSSQIVARDASTGELRAATADEAKALAAKTARSASLSRPMAKAHVSGAQGARLTDEFMSYSVVVRRADGSLSNVHFSSKEEAEAALKSPSALNKPATAPTE